MTGMDDRQELDRIKKAYQRRHPAPMDGFARLARAERENAYRLLLREAFSDLGSVRMIELGCGSGGELQRFIGLGIHPDRLHGVELIEARAAQARSSLPAAVTIECGDASRTGHADGSFDLVFLSTVLSSVLDTALRGRICAEAWRLTRPGGGVLWYDFVYDNPRNPDVRGISRRTVRTLFPLAMPRFRRVTLAPPLGRAACRIHPALYRILNAVPLLRTHDIAWIGKRAPAQSVAGR